MATYHHSGFDVVLQFSYHRENPNHDDDVEVLYSFQRSFFIRRDEFLSGNEDMRLFFAAFLLVLNISDSIAESMVDESISLAHLMVNDPKNVDRKVLRIAVDVRIRSEAGAIARARRDREFADEMARARRDREFADEMARARRDREFADVRARARRALPIAGHTRDDHDSIARGTRESMQAVKFVPATKSSIEALEKVTILDHNSCVQVEQCRVCLETLSTAADRESLRQWDSLASHNSTHWWRRLRIPVGDAERTERLISSATATTKGG